MIAIIAIYGNWLVVPVHKVAKFFSNGYLETKLISHIA